MATGSELVDVDKKPRRDQIRDSNNYTIEAYAKLAGATVDRLPLAGDDPELLKKQIAKALETCDVLITSGGVSMGAYDYTKAAFKELGAEILFERVALKPGKPTVFAKFENKLIFGLPGNPVSVAVTFNLFARPAMRAMQGATEKTLPEITAVLTRQVKASPDRDSYLPAVLRTDDGLTLAEPLKWGGSSDFVAFTRANGLITVGAGAALNGGEPAKCVCLPV
jgi:molybdopterin molybdotransferase